MTLSNPTTDVEHDMNVWGHSGAGYAGLTGQNKSIAPWTQAVGLG
jgi:hypothetical protein